MFKKSISLVLSIIMLMAMCAFAPVSYAEGDVLAKLGLVGKNNIISFDEDFSDYEAGTYTPATGGITTYATDCTGNFEITQTGALKATTADGALRRIGLRYDLATPVSTGLFTAGMTIDADEVNIIKDSSWTLFVLRDESEIAKSFIEHHPSNIMRDKSFNALSTQPQPDANGDYNLLFVASRETTQDNWGVEIYDVAGEDPVKIYSGSIDASYANIKSITFAHSYSTGEISTAIDNISVRTYESYETEDVNFYEDFSDFETGTYTPVKGGIATEKLAGDGTFEVTEKGALKATTTSGGERKVTLRYNFKNPVNKGVLTASMTLDNNETSIVDAYSSWTLFVLYNASGLESSITKYKDGIKNKAGAVLSPQPETDVDGKYHLKYVARRETAQDDWIVEIYDTVPTKPVKVYSATIASSFGYINSIDLVRSYSGGTTTTAIDDISITTAKEYKIENVDFNEDFSGYSVGTYTSVDGGIKTEQLAGTGSFEITEKGALKATTTGGGERKITLRYNLPSPVNKGLLTASMTLDSNEISIPDAFSSWLLFTLYNDTGAAETSLEQFKSSINGKAGGTVSQQPGLDADGKYHLKYTVGREAAQDEWLIEIYDTSGARPVKIYSRTMASSFGNISSIDFVRSYSTGTITTAIDDVSVTTSDSYEIDRSIDFSEDFSGYSAGTYTPADGGVTVNALAGTGNFEITEKGALKATTASGGERKITLGYNFPNPVNTGVLTVQMTLDSNEITIGDAFSSWNLFVMYNDSTLQTTLEKFKDTISGKQGAMSKQPQTDADGKYHLLYMARRETAQDTWLVEVYDTSATIPVIIYSGTMASTFGNISSVDFARSYSTGTITIAIDDIYVKTYESYELNRNFEFNFDSLEGANTSTQISDATGITFVDDAATVEVKDGALKLSHVNPNEKVNLKYSIPAIEKGTLSFSAKFGQDGTKDAGAWFISNFYNEAKKSSDFIHRYGIESYRWSANEKEYLDVTKNTETGMYHLRTVVSRDNKENDWTVRVWDDGGKGSKLVHQTSLSATDFSKIDAISIANSYSLGETNLLVDDVKIDYIEGIYVDSIAFVNGEETVGNITAGMTELTANVSIHSSNAEEKAVTVVLAVYSGEGRLIGISALPVTDLAITSKGYSLTANGFTTDIGSYAKVFFLENMSSICPVRANGGLFSEGFQF